MTCPCWTICWLKCMPLDGTASFLEISYGVHQFLFTRSLANSMLIFCTFVNIHVVLRYLWSLKYSFRHSWINIYVYFLINWAWLWPVFQLLPACKCLHCVMPYQHWSVKYMFIARGWELTSLQGEYWKILALGTGLTNTTLPAGMDTKSIPVEWHGLTVLKSILPW